MQISLISEVKIDLPWTAVMTKLRFIELLTETKTAEVTGIIKAIMMILALKEWLFETILSLTDAALTVATV